LPSETAIISLGQEHGAAPGLWLRHHWPTLGLTGQVGQEGESTALLLPGAPPKQEGPEAEGICLSHSRHIQLQYVLQCRALMRHRLSAKPA
jgi:hypothetical protein